MAKSARRYDFYLPLTDNDGRPFAGELFDWVERRLLAHFGGLNTQQREFPLRGIWQGGRVLDFRRQGSAGFVAQLKRNLLRTFEQLEILISIAD